MGVRAARAGAPTAAMTKLVAAKSTWPHAGTQKHLRSPEQKILASLAIFIAIMTCQVLD